MRVLELLAKQLDREAMIHETQAVQRVFTDGLEFWQLCMDAKRLFLEEMTAKEELKNDTHNK